MRTEAVAARRCRPLGGTKGCVKVVDDMCGRCHTGCSQAGGGRKQQVFTHAVTWLWGSFHAVASHPSSRPHAARASVVRSAAIAASFGST